MNQGKTRILLLIGLTLALGIFMIGYHGARAVSAAPAAQATPQATPDVPFYAEWAASGHADAESPAFTHWNEEESKTIPVGCAKCHSTTGFKDFTGADKSAAEKVDKAHDIGTTITCTACHNTATEALTSVTFPSGAVVNGLGREAVCMSCHQGVAAGSTVQAAIEKVNPPNEDTPMPNSQDKPGLTFTNIHYYAAAVSRYGKIVAGGYQYEGKQYDALFDHVNGVDTCQDCHDPHSLELKTTLCDDCHTGASTVAGVQKIRYLASTADYDGDGNVTEPIKDEVEGVRTLLLTALQSYAKDVAKAPIAYDAAAYPYFFNDTNGNGKADTDEAKFPNAYNSWTARSVKAAFNFQTVTKDPGGYAHGGKYLIQLMYDSIEDLNTKLTTKVDMAKLHRLDAGHFAGSEEAFRHWDAEEGIVPAGCVRCHTGNGLPQFVKEGTTTSMPASNGLLCETCHTDLAKPGESLVQVKAVPFPSGVTLGFGENNAANLCLECHQGRESTVSVNKAVGTSDPDKVNDKLSFRNVHYFAAGATLFGTDAKGMYEYKDMTYAGQFKHPAPADTCIGCHDAHMLSGDFAQCKTCHSTATSPEDIRMSTVGDFDGDGDDKEGLQGEIDTMAEKLLAAIQKYAKDKAGTAIGYSASTYPYFIIDANGNGKLEATETDRYATWTPRLLEAAYNYQYVQKDPGAAVHNGKYVIQVLYDSLKDIGGDVSKMKRPE
ncbi:MAG TPA: cytochrome c3 family protein [Anaerolineaceae bacterium]